MALLVMIATFFYINQPNVVMRLEPDESAEVVSSAYFSEPIQILEERQGWTKIETLVDSGKGWVQNKPFFRKENSYPIPHNGKMAQVKRCAAHVYQVQDTIFGPIITLPFESKLQILELHSDREGRWMKVKLPDDQEGYIQQGDVTLNCQPLNKKEMCNLSTLFLGLPYTWGGRSSFGYDCSGFTQMLYRQMGVHLQRTSQSQSRCLDLKTISIKKLSPGDLIFFGQSESEIHHVGLYLGNDQFIHATVSEQAPYIHISRLSDEEWSGQTKFPYRKARTLKK